MKIIKYFGFFIFSIIVILLFSTILNFDNSNAFDSITSFLSITTGFTITALSIISTSSFSKSLYKIEDKKDNSKTLLHILVGQFRSSTIIFVLTIGIILVFKFYPIKGDCLFEIKTYSISFDILLKSLIWYMTIISLISFFRLFNTFAKFVIKSATNI